jgi:hypothetical protein
VADLMLWVKVKCMFVDHKRNLQTASLTGNPTFDAVEAACAALTPRAAVLGGLQVSNEQGW